MPNIFILCCLLYVVAVVVVAEVTETDISGRNQRYKTKINQLFSQAFKPQNYHFPYFWVSNIG